MTDSKKGNLIRYGILVATLLTYNILLIIIKYAVDTDAGQLAYLLSCVPFFISYGIASFLITRKVIIPNLLLLAFELVTTGPFLKMNDLWIFVFISFVFSFVSFLICKTRNRSKSKND